MFQLVRIDLEQTRLGETVVLDKWPFTIGRDSGADWMLECPGVWESHGSFNLDVHERPYFKCREDASCLINDRMIDGSSTLKSGDILKIGSVAVRLDLLPTVQKSAFLRELILSCLALVFVASQFYFIYRYLSE